MEIAGLKNCVDIPKYLLELIPQAENANKGSVRSQKELTELREELKETSDGKKLLNPLMPEDPIWGHIY